MNELVKKYAEGYEQVARAIGNLTEEELQFKPGEKQWSIKEIIIHLADAEVVGVHRMKAVLSEHLPLLTHFDQDLWADRQDYRNLDHRPYLELFRLLRESMAALLNRIADEDWERAGIHTAAGKLTLRDLVQRYVKHVEDHLRQIERVLTVYRNRNL